MKATPAQSLVIDKIVAHIQSWKTSPDINSPTHYSLNREFAEELTENGDDKDTAMLCEAIDTLYSFVSSAIRE